MSPPQAPARTSSPAELHLAILLAALLVLGLSTTLTIAEARSVALPGLGWTLPELCTFQRTLGVGCPGCGLTRSFISLAHGQVAQSLDYNPAGILLFAVVVAQLPYRGWMLWRIRQRRPAPPLASTRATTLAVVALALVLLAQWLGRAAITLVVERGA